jgi:hypothetical protein
VKPAIDPFMRFSLMYRDFPDGATIMLNVASSPLENGEPGSKESAPVVGSIEYPEISLVSLGYVSCSTYRCVASGVIASTVGAPFGSVNGDPAIGVNAPVDASIVYPTILSVFVDEQ